MDKAYRVYQEDIMAVTFIDGSGLLLTFSLKNNRYLRHSMGIINHTIFNSYTNSNAIGTVWSMPVYKKAFSCFCNKLYFFSNFKDFNTLAPA